jgi:L-asparagine transporter-like permease
MSTVSICSSSRRASQHAETTNTQKAAWSAQSDRTRHRGSNRRWYFSEARAIALQAGLACLLVVLGTFNQIVAYFLFVVVLFIALTVIGLFVLRRRASGVEPAYRAAGYPVTPLIFLGFEALLLAMLLVHNPKQSILGVFVVLLGIPIYYLAFGRKATRRTAENLD